MSVAVVVLGDVGRSPRMQYHAKSLADRASSRLKVSNMIGTVFSLVDTGAATPGVSLVGYRGEPCVPDVENHEMITQYLIEPYTTSLPRALFIVYAPLKALVLLWRLAYVLFFVIPRPDVILVQCPPGIPSLFVVWACARVYGARMVIDWHNFGFTVLAKARGRYHPFVAMCHAYENNFATRADAHLCVTNAMREWMTAHWHVTPTVLYDRAPSFFKKTEAKERHELFQRLAPQLAGACKAFAGKAAEATEDAAPAAEAAEDGAEATEDAAPAAAATEDGAEATEDAAPAAAAAEDGAQPAEKAEDGSTLFTTKEGQLRPDRPALVISSTSWTEDEDFGLLLAAAQALDERIREDSAFPRVLFVVTGKGPLKQMYEKRMAALELRRVHLCTMWLEPKDYPLLLGSADLGVCLHTSTSEMDLPMKVVDMFGCGLPVCAVGFKCLSELVKHEENGLVFSSSPELCDQMAEVLKGCTSDAGNAKLKKLAAGVGGLDGWDLNWTKHAAPTFLVTSRTASWNVKLRVTAVLVALHSVLVAFLLAPRSTAVILMTCTLWLTL